MYDSKKKGGFKGGSGGKRFGGGSKFGGKKFGGGGSDRAEMHSAICDQCDKECQVPFKPTGDRPVFCNNCFKSQGEKPGKSDRKDFGDRGYEKRDRPAPNMENVYTTKGNAGAGVGAGNADQYKKQFDALNAKLDRIIKLLTEDEPEMLEAMEDESPES